MTTHTVAVLVGTLTLAGGSPPPTAIQYGSSCQRFYDGSVGGHDWMPELSMAVGNCHGFEHDFSPAGAVEIFDTDLNWTKQPQFDNGYITAPGPHGGGPTNGIDVFFSYGHGSSTADNASLNGLVQWPMYPYQIWSNTVGNAGFMSEPFDLWAAWACDTITAWRPQDRWRVPFGGAPQTAAGMGFFAGSYDLMWDTYWGIRWQNGDGVGGAMASYLTQGQDYSSAWQSATWNLITNNHPAALTVAVEGLGSHATEAQCQYNITHASLANRVMKVTQGGVSTSGPITAFRLCSANLN